MPFFSLFKSGGSAFDTLILSWTSHPRLVCAAGPRDYDQILDRTISEVKFHCETLLAILFFMATIGELPCLISWTLACLLFTLMTYMVLDGLSGEVLHLWIESASYKRALFACLTKLPALWVLGSLCTLALSQWDTPFTAFMLCCVAGALVITFAVRLRVHVVFVRAGTWVVGTIKSLGRVVSHARGAEGGVEEKQSGEKKDNEVVLPELPYGPERV
ncbi:hypothetical protein M0805_000551 [Coniferiporia weirii]|nr:hypothetical protein M0805_000551 [Coniferiporia weirii]